MPSAPNLNPPASSVAVHAAIFRAKAPQRGENLNPERGSEQVKCVSARAAAEFHGAFDRGLALELTREPGERIGVMVEDGGAVEAIGAARRDRHEPEWRRAMAEKSFSQRREDDAKTVSGERIEGSTRGVAHDEERDTAQAENLDRHPAVTGVSQSERDWAWWLEALRSGLHPAIVRARLEERRADDEPEPDTTRGARSRARSHRFGRRCQPRRTNADGRRGTRPGRGKAVAIYHLNVKTGSRDGGQSARARAQYIVREGKDEKDRDALAHSESGHMPEWAEDDPRQYWAAADAHERVNGRLFVAVECALPKELNEAQQRTLAGSFAAELTGRERLPYTMALRRGGGENPHVHLMISERALDGHDRDAERWFKRYNRKAPEKGGARKTRSIKGKEWLENTRRGWARAANRALEAAGRAERIDHRTLAAQHAEALERGELERAAERARIPGIHLGPERYRAARGGHSRVVEMAAAIERRNRADRAELAEHRSQVECAEAEVRDLEQQIRALDSEISAARRRAAWERIRTQPAAGLKAGVQWIRETLRTRPGARKRMERESPAREIER